VSGAIQPAAIIDTHIHLDEPVFDGDREAVMTAARAAGVGRFVNIAYSPERWSTSAALREQFAEIDIAVGLHPQLAEDLTSAVQRSLETAVAELQPVAIGETGFDLFRGGSSLEAQRLSFRFQAALAADSGLPLVIHQRAASDHLIDELDRWPVLEFIVLHSFDGTPRLVDWALDRGCLVGIGGLATKATSVELRGLLMNVPPDRLVLETDAPYLSPPGSPRRNTPANLPVIADRLAPLWGLTGTELCRVTAENARRVFRLRN
jgi:TatD DNase family protein